MIKQQEIATDTPIPRSDFLKNVAVEIAAELSNNFDDVDYKNTYDTIGLLAEEREVMQNEIAGVVIMVMAKLYVDLVLSYRESKKDEQNEKGVFDNRDEHKPELGIWANL